MNNLAQENQEYQELKLNKKQENQGERRLSVSPEIEKENEKLSHKKSIESSLSDINMVNHDIRALLKIKKVIRSKSSKTVLKSQGISLGLREELNVDNSDISNGNKSIPTINSPLNKDKKSVSFKVDFVNIIEIDKDEFTISEDSNKIRCGKFCDCLIF